MDQKLKNFYEALMSHRADIQTKGEFTNKDVKEFAKETGTSIPGAVWQNKAARGVLVVPSEYRGGTVASRIHVVPEIPEEVKAANMEMIRAANQNATDYTMVKTFVPEVDPHYVPFGNYKDVEAVIKSGIFYPMYITGLSGNGKSTMIEQICAKHKRKLIRISLTALTDEDQLIGSKTLVDGNIRTIEGPILIAMREGIPVLIDEIDAGNANALLCLQGPLEGKPYYSKLTNEIIHPTHGFNIIATANTKGKGNDGGQFIGTNIQNEAFLERFGATFEQEYPSQKIEQKIIMSIMESLNCVDEEFSNTLSKWADAIRRTYESGGIDEIMSTRRVIHIIKAYSVFHDKKKAVELCCNRFDSQTKQAFIDMYSAMSADTTAPVEEVPMV